MPTYESAKMANAAVGYEHFALANATGLARSERMKRISNMKALGDLTCQTGLDKNESLFTWYQKTFSFLGAQSYDFESTKLKSYIGLMGLCMESLFSVKLPIPQAWYDYRLENYYTLTEVSPWAEAYVELSRHEKKFSAYVRDWINLKSGRKDYEYNNFTGKKEDIYFEEEYSLRLELGQEYATLFFARLKELLSLDKKASTLQILQRNVSLKNLVAEANSYSSELSSIMHIELKDECEKLKGNDSLSKLCATSIMGALYGHDFDIDTFQERVVQILWQELVDLQKSDEQKQMVEIIRRQISGELYQGMQEVN